MHWQDTRGLRCSGIRRFYVSEDFRFGAFCPSVLGVSLFSVSLGRLASPSFWCSVDRFGFLVVVVGLIASVIIALLIAATGEIARCSTSPIRSNGRTCPIGRLQRLVTELWALVTSGATSFEQA
jgi:hypothetical protein